MNQETNHISAEVNGNSNLEIQIQGDKLSINGKHFIWDIIKLHDNRWHILNNGKSYIVNEIRTNYLTKTFCFTLNNVVYNIELKDQLDLVIEKMGIPKSPVLSNNKIITAPMPGLIGDILVTKGDKILRGGNLLVLKAMKMENVLKSPNSGIVKAIFVKVNQNVEKGQKLIQF